jgi:chromosome segregation ATPase
MKKTILTITMSTLTFSSILTSCNSNSEKVENAEKEVAAAQEKLDQANEDYLIEIENYRIASREKMAANERSLNEFKSRIESEKEEARTDYETRIAELEKKNTDLKKILDDYKASGKENWEAFKIEFNRDLEALGQAFRDLVVMNN